MAEDENRDPLPQEEAVRLQERDRKEEQTLMEFVRNLDNIPPDKRQDIESFYINLQPLKT